MNSSTLQHGALLHLCLVQQHYHGRAAVPVGGASAQHQLQRDGARVSAGPEEQDGPQPPAGVGRRHGGVFTRLLSELG